MSVIRHDIGINADISKVYGALTCTKALSSWWTTDVKGESKEGEILHFGFGDWGAAQMRVTGLVPDKGVKWRCEKGAPGWENSELTFDLRKEGDWTYVSFSHDWKSKDQALLPHCSTKWAYFLFSLKGLVEGTGSTPFPYDSPTMEMKA